MLLKNKENMKMIVQIPEHIIENPEPITGEGVVD